MSWQAFLNGILITDAGLIPDGIVTAREGRIEYVGARDESLIPAGAEREDAGGNYISPGFVDIHVHRGAGSDFMDANPQDIETVFRYHAEHGTTSFCPTTVTAPLEDILAAPEEFQNYSRGSQSVGRYLAAHIEGPYLSMTKRGCHLPEYVRNPEESEWKQMLERGPVATMTLAPELPGARPLIQELHGRNIRASAGHSEALFHEVEESIAWGGNTRHTPLLRHDRRDEQPMAAESLAAAQRWHCRGCIFERPHDFGTDY